MHALFERASGLTEAIIAAAIEVHCDKGPGLIESIYEWSAQRAGPARSGVRQSEICPDRIQRLHAGGATALRCVGGKLRACRGQGRGESPSDPQGTTLELHEAAERSCRTTYQLPRDERHRWYPPVDSI